MKKNTPNVATHLLENPASYLLRIGGISRKLSLDELPNLINIIKGGNGISGAQINGRDEISIEAKVALEKEYLDRKSVWFDLLIVVRTFTSVLFSKGVAH